MERELRKQQNLLVAAGIGVILLNVWSIAKLNMYLGMSGELLAEIRSIAHQSGIHETAFYVLFWTIISIMMAASLGIHMYIGVSAVSDGRGRKKGYGYILAATGLLLFSLNVMWQSFFEDGWSTWETFDPNQITGFLMELTFLYVLLELLIAGIRVKRLRKQMKG